MSTKCSLAYSHEAPAFHLYRELFDDENVYLELRGDGMEYEVSPGRVMVRIPLAVWEAIRQHPGSDSQAQES
jgi:hypothetical protein